MEQDCGRVLIVHVNNSKAQTVSKKDDGSAYVLFTTIQMHEVVLFVLRNRNEQTMCLVWKK